MTISFLLTLDRDGEGRSGWVAESVEFPGCISQGRSVEDAVWNVRGALADLITSDEDVLSEEARRKGEEIFGRMSEPGAIQVGVDPAEYESSPSPVDSS